MTKFNVGDEVILSTRPGARATVEYGPFDGENVYVVKLVDEPADPDDARTFTVLANVMKPAPKFAVGDKVRYSTWGAGTITFGPFTDDDLECYLVDFPGLRHTQVGTRYLTKAVEPAPIKVGDRVRILRATHAEHCHGRTGVVTSTSNDWRATRGDTHPYIVRLDDGGTLHVAELERLDSSPADTYEYDGVTYDLTATYRDRDGDVWEFGTRRENGEPRIHCPASGYDDLGDVIDAYGPLTRI